MATTRTPHIDLKRELKELYSGSSTPVLVDVPRLTFLSVDGAGDPNTAPAYREAVEALYAAAYWLKYALKRAPDGLDFTVMPLEGLWWADDAAAFSAARKEEWQWTAMIAQPDAVTTDMLAAAKADLGRMKDLPALDCLRLEKFAEGRAAQILHIGPYSEEGPTIARLHAFIRERGYTFDGRRQRHHEIYLSDMRRTAPSRLKTIIRQPFVAADPSGA